MSKSYPTNILVQLHSASAAWKVIDPKLTFGNLSLTKLEDTIERGEALKREITALEIQLTDLRNQRDQVYQTGWGHLKRLHVGIKAHYGDDSAQYEMIGGTRLSQRKPHTRKVKITKPAPTD
ncbi:MAG: hypothetical protein NT121_25800 [Chloroflexi bacterium]|nr:hypothetical protein [Chloroflexota bacterium]